MEPQTKDPFKALGDPTRRRIVEQLASRERAVEELVAQSGQGYGVVSQHLQVLLAAGLVTRRAEGRRRIYALRGEAIGEIEGWLGGLRRNWERKLDRLDRFLDRRS